MNKQSYNMKVGGTGKFRSRDGKTHTGMYLIKHKLKVWVYLDLDRMSIKTSFKFI